MPSNYINKKSASSLTLMMFSDQGFRKPCKELRDLAELGQNVTKHERSKQNLADQEETYNLP